MTELHQAAVKLLDGLIAVSSARDGRPDDADAIFELVHLLLDDSPGVPLPSAEVTAFGLAYALALAIQRLAAS